jgi:hypothetical protein
MMMFCFFGKTLHSASALPTYSFDVLYTYTGICVIGIPTVLLARTTHSSESNHRLNSCLRTNLYTVCNFSPNHY